MKKTLAIMGMGLVGITFGLDEYLSIPQGKLEIDAGYWLTMGTGRYDDEGKKQDLPDEADGPMLHSFPLQLKYGIIEGLDVELATSGLIGNKDAGEPGGFTQPQLALKYTHAPVNAGAFVNLVLPFATGNLNDPEPAMGLALGAVYGNRFGDFRLTGLASYQINMENEDKEKDGNVLFIYAKPEAMWTEFIGTYLGLQYTMFGDGEIDGESEIAGFDVDPGGYLVSLVPGANVQLLNWLAYEVNAPITVLGKNVGASWGIGASVYVTLPK